MSDAVRYWLGFAIVATVIGGGVLVETVAFYTMLSKAQRRDVHITLGVVALVLLGVWLMGTGAPGVRP